MKENKVIIDLGNLADWFSGVGSLVTAGIAIWLATRDSRKKLSISIIKDDIKNMHTNNECNTYQILLHNIRSKRVHIRYLGFYYRKGFKLKLIRRVMESEKVLMDSISYDETITYVQKVNLGAFERITKNKLKKMYVVIEDIDGKRYKTRFKP